MFSFTLLAFLCCAFSLSAGAIVKRYASHSGEYGGTLGTRFSHSVNQLDGPITAIKIRVYSSYITGLQVRYGRDWSDYVGGTAGELHHIVLHPGEGIDHVSGMADSYLRKLEFHTSLRRHFSFGVAAGTAFSGIPLFPNSALSYLSGRADSSYVYAISFHWLMRRTQGNQLQAKTN
ncbi:zymogen granule membrane protein 16-like [Sphaerodactylus townsendi]|uniref:zymogen granule membrane protein 16-like n=1 Tax=Sphaerodactylus townsendi TaxID=933632 RepID=UPI0020271966|nr:zymogen granule membrane protein 16-like [Sphaerodactylus townsendi]XP_048373686.1 zymogen granule membrane protein 16-like [Sphaerodactylus townsendi]XP_048373687.1 zymogen granule membrane protein 16-like [Sphaerodactylus townsendi]